MQIGPNFPEGTFGVHVASGALGAHGRLRATPLATNCWPKAPRGGGGGGGRGSWRPRTRGVAPPVCNTLDFPALVYDQNAHNELGNAVPRVFFC